MIVVCRMGEVAPNTYDQVWAIVRSLKSGAPWMKQVPELSPSWELFGTYRYLSSVGKWGADAFNRLYVPRFLEEMHSRESRDKLNELCVLSRTSSIALVCFCRDESLCHRSIVGGMLKGAGCGVAMSTDGLRYYDMYKNI